LEVVAKAVVSVQFFSSASSMCPATVWIIFTRILNVILASYYNCSVRLF